MEISDQKRIANQQNAQKSTGPRSAEGKARSSRNALQHGFRSKSALLPGENPEEYYELKSRLRAEWKPASETEEFCVEQLLLNQWRLRRIANMEQDLFVEAFEGSMGSFGSGEEEAPEFDANLPGALTPALLDNRLALLTRYENSLRRAYYKALNELKALQTERRKQYQAEQKAAHDAHVRQIVGEAEQANEAFNQQLIAMCERIPAVPNDGHKYIVPRDRFGNEVGSIGTPSKKDAA
jgi:hypothetical protein